MNSPDDPLPESQAAEREEEASLDVVRETVRELDPDQLAASSEEAPVVKLANLILVEAVKNRATQVLIEPLSGALRLRYRIDGVLSDRDPLPKRMQLALLSRFKIMCSLDIAERRLPQDGMMRIRVNGVDYDCRVSLIPTMHGERCVVRMLNKSSTLSKLEEIGMEEGTLRRFRKAVHASGGLVLVTGPTGSGKTTTIYSVLAELNKSDIDIITVEDPIEYEIRGITQISVRNEIGLTFANTLRSLLRQAPDVIMVGEIRDAETAEIAVEAALSGHRVFSTMHCNQAAGALSRLDDMGIAPFLVSSSVTLACAQRLVRKICPHCKERVDYPATALGELNLTSDFFSGTTLFRGRGCDRCNRIGYQGRTALVEALTVDEEIRKLVIARASARDIGNLAIERGMKTLRDVAMMKVREGVITLEQALANTPAEDPGAS